MKWILDIQFFGGRGARSGGDGGGGGAVGGEIGPVEDYPEAFADGVDFSERGDVEHSSRFVASSVRSDWRDFSEEFGSDPSALDETVLYKEYDSRTGSVYGYIRTSNAFEINKKLYDPDNDGKTDREIFTRRDRSGSLRDLRTVQALDRNIETHETPRDASYTRYCTADAIKSSFGLSNEQLRMLADAKSLDSSQLSALSTAMRGTSSYSKAYTSTSGNRSLNAFSSYKFERRINVPKGTKAFAARNNAQESEVIFGRGLKTVITGISVSSDGHIVIHESYDGYR